MIKQLQLLLIMRKRTLLFKILGIISLTLMALAILWISRLFLVLPTNENAHYLPKEAAWTIKLDGNAFLKQGFSEAFFAREENELIELIQELVQNRTSDEQQKLGIDFFSDVYLSQVNTSNVDVIVFSFNLSDCSEFEAWGKTIDFGKIAISDDRLVGILVTPKNTKANLSSKTLTSFAEQFAKKSTIPTESFSIEKTELSSLRLNGDEYKGDVHFFVNDHDVSWEGDVTFRSPSTFPKKRLQPNGFHFSSAFLPKELNDSLSVYVHAILPTIPHHLESISLNMRGIDITDDENVMFLPEMDLLLSYSDSINLTELLQEQSTLGTLLDLTSTTFQLAGKTFYYEQVDATTIYVGRTKADLIENEHLLSISGSPNVFVNIHGDQSYVRFARMLPTFRALEKFMNITEKIECSVDLSKNDTSHVTGSMSFTPGNSPIGSIFELLVKTNAFD